LPNTPPPIPAHVARSFAQGIEARPKTEFYPSLPQASQPRVKRSLPASDSFALRRLIPTAPSKPFHDYTPRELNEISSQLASIKKTETDSITQGEICKLELTIQKLHRTVFSNNISSASQASVQPVTERNHFQSPVALSRRQRRAKEEKRPHSPFSVYTPKRLEKKQGNSYF